MSKMQALRRISPEDLQGAPDWYIEQVLPFQNDFNEQVYNQLGGGLSTVNTVDRYKEVDLDHGVQTRVKIPDGMRTVEGITAVRCVGVEMSGGRPTRKLYTLGIPNLTWQLATTKGQVLVTASFLSGSSPRGRVNLKFLGG